MSFYAGYLSLDPANSQAWLRSAAVPNGIVLVLDAAGNDYNAYVALSPPNFSNGQHVRIDGQVSRYGGTQVALFMQSARALP